MYKKNFTLFSYLFIYFFIFIAITVLFVFSSLYLAIKAKIKRIFLFNITKR